MKKTMFFLLALLGAMSVSACAPDSSTTKNEISYETISFSFDGVIDMLYSPEDGKYILEYMDVDAIDVTDYDDDYIVIEVSKRNFFELLDDFDKSLEEQLSIEIANKWQIKRKDVTTIPYYKYELIKAKK